jgi:hypothetical protein
MKTQSWILCLLCTLFGGGCAVAPTAVEAQQAVPAVSGPPDALEQLVAPIALYPDALVAIILPAATASSDIVLASRYLDAGGDPNNVDGQPWDDSVKSLVHYPELVRWMNQNLDWAEEIGDAYADQPDDVMNAIQRARARAMANGTLVSTEQQQVVVEDGYIRVVPAQPEAIYVPRYDPEIIFMDQPPDFFPGPLITWGPAFGVGFWLSFDCDWGHRSIWHDPHSREHWRGHHDWRRREIGRPGHPVAGHRGWQQWRPPPGRRPHRPPHFSPHDTHREVHRPAPIAGAPHFDRNRVHAPPRHRDDHTRREPPRQVNAPERRGTPPHAAPRRPVPAPSAHRTVPPATHRNEPKPVAHPPGKRAEPSHVPVPPPQQRRREEPRRDDRDTRRETPQAAKPPVVHREPPRPQSHEAPRVVAPPPRRVAPARQPERRSTPPPSRAVPQRVAPSVQHSAPTVQRAAPPAQRSAPPVQRAAPHPPPPPPRAERQDNGNNNNNNNRQPDRHDDRDRSHH